MRIFWFFFRVYKYIISAFALLELVDSYPSHRFAYLEFLISKKIAEKCVTSDMIAMLLLNTNADDYALSELR